MQFSTESWEDGEIIQDLSQSFKVAVEAQRHIWSDDRLQEFDKSKLLTPKIKFQSLSWDPCDKAKYWCAVAQPHFVFIGSR